MAKKMIDSQISYALGQMAGKKESLQKMIELHFDYLKQYYINEMNSIFDEQIIDELFDNPSFFTNQRNKDYLDSIMFSIRNSAREYEQKKEKEEQENGVKEQ